MQHIRFADGLAYDVPSLIASLSATSGLALQFPIAQRRGDLLSAPLFATRVPRDQIDCLGIPA